MTDFLKRHTFAIIGLLFLTLGYASLWESLLLFPHHVGPADWELFSSYIETFRKTVVEFRQFPWWNPYSAGGYPYFGNPLTFGVFSLPHALSLFIGSLAALKLSALLSAVLAFFGMYRLAARFTEDRLYRAVAAVVFAVNGGIVIHLSVGHFFWDYYFYPWIILSVLEMNDTRDRSWHSAVLGGVVLGVSIQSAIHYGFIYQLITIAGFFVAGAWRRRREPAGLLNLTETYLLMGAVALAIGGSRIVLCQEVMRDFPRIQRWEMNAGILRTLKLYFYPFQSILTEGGSPLGWWEWGCYVGALAGGVFLFSMWRKIRFYHVIFFVGFLLYFKNERPWPYYWINSYVPVFKAMRIAARIRIWAMPFFAMGVAVGLQNLGQRWHRVARVLAFLIMADISLASFYTLHTAFKDRQENLASDAWPANPHAYPLTYQDKLGQGSGLFRTLRQNFAHTPGYEPALSPLLWPLPLEALPLKGFNSPDYRGEFYTAEGPVEPSSWSPNRIEFKNLRGPLFLNMNLGSYWRVNGAELFAGQKVAEIERPSKVSPDANGDIVLEALPKNLRRAGLVTLASFLLSLYLVRRRLRGIRGGSG